jgi:hypothetical protein
VDEQVSVYILKMYANFYSFRGADWDTNLAVDHSVSVRSLMRELYAKACMAQSWALVRLAAGLLRRHHEDLAKAVTHLLVRQKQVTIGLPTQREVPITVPESPLVLKTLFEQGKTRVYTGLTRLQYTNTMAIRACSPKKSSSTWAHSCAPSPNCSSRCYVCASA